MATRAEIIDDFFRNLDAFPDVPYQPVGAALVEECESMGPDGLFVSTAAALLEQESGGKNVFGCDWGERWITDPPYCQVAVTEERVKKLIANFHQPPAGVGANGVGVTQITTMALVEEAEGIGGAHLVRQQMRVGFRYLNNLIALFGWPEGAAAYNAGPGNLQSVMATYGADMARREREWAARLEDASDTLEESEVSTEVPDSLVPAGFVPLAPRAGNYLDEHPTRYEWRDDVAEVIHRLYRKFGSAIHVNTYVEHPGDENGRFARDTAAFDVWGEGGRRGEGGSTFFLPSALGDQVYRFLFDDLNPPDIDWIIYKREMWTRATFAPRRFGFDDFTWHDDHIHVTYTGDFRLLDGVPSWIGIGADGVLRADGPYERGWYDTDNETGELYPPWAGSGEALVNPPSWIGIGADGVLRADGTYERGWYNTDNRTGELYPEEVGGEARANPPRWIGIGADDALRADGPYERGWYDTDNQTGELYPPWFRP